MYLHELLEKIKGQSVELSYSGAGGLQVDVFPREANESNASYEITIEAGNEDDGPDFYVEEL